MSENHTPEIQGNLRRFMLRVPEEIGACTGIRIMGRRIRSFLFSTDVSIIRNTNADAVIAVYPFTPQPVITQALISAADTPVLVGVGGGLTQGIRVVNLALHAEFQGALGVVVNSPTADDVIRELKETVDIPVVVTVVSEKDDIGKRLEAGTDIINVSGAAKTAQLVALIRQDYPDVLIIATGGQTPESIAATVAAGANAITWTPPSTGQIFRDIMEAYRNNEPHPEF